MSLCKNCYLEIVKTEGKMGWLHKEPDKCASPEPFAQQCYCHACCEGDEGTIYLHCK